MNTNLSYYRFLCSFLLLLFVLLIQMGHAQQSDTTEAIKELEQEEAFFQPYHSERSVENMYMTETGTFGIPEPKQYYTPPFMGQKYLEAALAEYYEKLKEEKSLLYRFINAVAPFIDNQFEFAVYRIYDLPIVERDQPMLDPQLNAKKQRQ